MLRACAWISSKRIWNSEWMSEFSCTSFAITVDLQLCITEEENKHFSHKCQISCVRFWIMILKVDPTERCWNIVIQIQHAQWQLPTFFMACTVFKVGVLKSWLTQLFYVEHSVHFIEQLTHICSSISTNICGVQFKFYSISAVDSNKSDRIMPPKIYRIENPLFLLGLYTASMFCKFLCMLSGTKLNKHDMKTNFSLNGQYMMIISVRIK